MNREQITIRLPSKLKQRIQKEADGMGISFNAMLIIFLERGLKDQ